MRSLTHVFHLGPDFEPQDIMQDVRQQFTMIMKGCQRFLAVGKEVAHSSASVL